MSNNSLSPFTEIDWVIECLIGLGYKVGGIDEIIDDGINGYSFDLEDESLINKLIDLIEDRELRLKMSFEARKKAVSNYDSRVIATKILSEIESLSS